MPGPFLSQKIAELVALRPGEDQSNDVVVVEQGQYLSEAVAASQTAQVLGGTGAIGDFLHKVVIVPETTSPGQVLLLDGAVSFTLFVGGASSVADLKPIDVELNEKTTTGAWKITTGTAVHVKAIGRFSA